MRKRLSSAQRKAQILAHARQLFHERGYARTEMEDVRRACEVSRGGLYHHFDSKRAILDAIVTEEVAALVTALDDAEGCPIVALLQAGSAQLGRDAGIAAALREMSAKRAYLSSLDQAVARDLAPRLSAALVPFVVDGAPPAHVATLFLVANDHLNRRVLLGDWTSAEGTAFAATALRALAPLLKRPDTLANVIASLAAAGTQP